MAEILTSTEEHIVEGLRQGLQDTGYDEASFHEGEPGALSERIMFWRNVINKTIGNKEK